MGDELEIVVGTTASERRAERVRQHHDQCQESLAHKLAYGGSERRTALNLRVRGELVFYWIPDIEELKRTGDLYGALNLARECMVAVGNNREWDTMPPGWAAKVAIIERKLGNYRAEVDVLEHVLEMNRSFPEQFPPADVEKRLTKARSCSWRSQLSVRSSFDEILQPGQINYLDWLFEEWPDTLGFNDTMRFMHSSGALVTRWLQRGELPGDRSGGHWRISKTELRAAFEAGSNHTMEPVRRPEPEPPTARKPWLEKTLEEIGRSRI
ncbi:helix-turn-helix domain-containing protein [Subtercola sp. YIM 133946]|uniref:helix-turn-helix domain-containing protein n=1 Tax=Subtercola sp. YIM 133946 TaxID=3118909 RepID=UPI002F92C40D